MFEHSFITEMLSFAPMVYLGAIFMGLCLGLLGSGGSILAVPLLIYLAKEPEKVAIAESLLIVGLVAFVGGLSHLKSKNVDFKLIILFGFPSMLTAILGAYLSQFISANVQLLIFGLVMLSASAFMLKPVSKIVAPQSVSYSILPLLLSGSFVGVLAGLVGVGGGFLIVPALLLIAKVAMQKAIATSLFIIAIQSLAGFSKYALFFLQHAPSNTGPALGETLLTKQLHFNWPLILLVLLCALIGVVAGSKLNQNVEQQSLKKLFAIALIPLSGFILYSNI